MHCNIAFCSEILLYQKVAYSIISQFRYSIFQVLMLHPELFGDLANIPVSEPPSSVGDMVLSL